MAKVYCSKCGTFIAEDDRFGVDARLLSTCVTCAAKAKAKKDKNKPRPPHNGTVLHKGGST